MEFAFWFFVVSCFYPYVIFPTILRACAMIARRPERNRASVDGSTGAEPFTIILLVHNEEANVERKIKETIPSLETHSQNLLLVVSDHSSDNTVAVATAVAHPQVRVVASRVGRGKALASNFAVGLADNELLLFTDVETLVPDETIRTMLSVLRCEGVGCVNPEIVFGHKSGDEVSEAAGFYWRFEMWLRTIETSLRLYATSSGPCMAVRRSLFRELPPTGDADFTTPLDIVEQGYLCVHLPECYAYDVMPASAGAEFKARTRMVAKNFAGTLSRWGIRNIFKHPAYTWALYSHKIMRWLVPFFMLGAFLCNVMLINQYWLYDLALALQVAFYLLALVGWIGYRHKRKWPVAQKIFAFVLANLAFSLGILKAVTGRVPSYYVPTSQL